MPRCCESRGRRPARAGRRHRCAAALCAVSGGSWIEQAHLDRPPVAMGALDRRPTRSAPLAPKCDAELNVL